MVSVPGLNDFYTGILEEMDHKFQQCWAVFYSSIGQMRFVGHSDAVASLNKQAMCLPLLSLKGKGTDEMCLTRCLAKFDEALYLEQNKNNQSRRKDKLILCSKITQKGLQMSFSSEEL